MFQNGISRRRDPNSGDACVGNEVLLGTSEDRPGINSFRPVPTFQRWVYFIQENPHYTSPEPLKYNGMFNWTMTYKRSSDVWAPYGTYRTVKNNDLRRSYFSSGAGYFLFVFLLVAGVAKTLESLSKEVLFTMPSTSTVRGLFHYWAVVLPKFLE